MGSVGAKAMLAGAVVVSGVAGCLIFRPALAQQSASAPAANPPPVDELQKADKIYQFRKAALSGPERGREIFYYKCWFCHNEFTKDVPKLDGLFRRSMLISGQPVNDETVKNQIRNGSADMAAYKYTLSEADLNDLVSFLRQECCWNSDAPPLNPVYPAR